MNDSTTLLAVAQASINEILITGNCFFVSLFLTQDNDEEDN